MERMNSRIVGSMLAFTLAAGAEVALADQVFYAKKKGATHGSMQGIKATPNSEGGWNLGKGWKIKSSGGLAYMHPEDDRYWFEFSGVARLDHTTFMGSAASKGTNFPSGSNIRALETYLDGGVGENWVYNLSLSFDGSSASFS